MMLSAHCTMAESGLRISCDVVSIKLSSCLFDSLACVACAACSCSPHFCREISVMHPMISRISPSSDISGKIEQRTHLCRCVGGNSLTSLLDMHQVLLRRSSKDLRSVSPSLQHGRCILLGLLCRCQCLKVLFAERNILVVDERIPNIIERQAPIICTTNIEPSLVAVRIDALHSHVYNEDSDVASLCKTLTSILVGYTACRATKESELHT